MEFKVPENIAKIRLDKYISEQVDMTRSAVVTLINSKSIYVNGFNKNKNYIVCPGDLIKIIVPKPIPTIAQPEDIPLDIVFEDQYLLVVNKKRGMVVHPAVGNHNGTLVNALLFHCGDSLSGINGVIRPGIVHRIDKDTSGLLIVAKTDKAHVELANQIKIHSFLRVYNGLVYGHLKEKSGTIDLPIGRDSKDRKKMAVTDKNSKNAITEYTVLEEYDNFSIVQFKLKTGRTHQIRVHMAYIGHAVVGDPLYSPGNIKKNLLTGQMLHAKTIGFVHPITGQYLEFTSALPDYFIEFIDSYKDKLLTK